MKASRAWSRTGILAGLLVLALSVFVVACGGDDDETAAGVDDPNAHRITMDPDPYEPFNIALGYRVGNLLYISGQASLDFESGDLVGVGDFEAQATQTFENLSRVLEAGGSSMEQVVKVTIFLTDMDNFPRIVELREEYFTPPYPADTIVEVSSLALPELEIEIEAIALAEGEIVDAGD